MDTRLTQADAAYFLPAATPEQERLRALRQASGAAYRAGLLRGVGRVLSRMGDALLGSLRRARVRAELRALTDRELADIGLTRGDIDHVLAADEAASAPRATVEHPAGIGARRAA